MLKNSGLFNDGHAVFLSLYAEMQMCLKAASETLISCMDSNSLRIDKSSKVKYV